jgi:hypothetical protein
MDHPGGLLTGAALAWAASAARRFSAHAAQRSGFVVDGGGTPEGAGVAAGVAPFGPGGGTPELNAFRTFSKSSSV